ncbi:adenine phosphoribosyltransferase [Candidatus Nitrosacidococcus tergens]|uniref:Adenine phosphoribosyltransferase n=1 Tax=Candidatus Nitrosacidococcus tergens TaxID=553981 RepID=A0A7G1QA68_9GAMM|nr:adenine phosphoribosyltransferase [Candidatus Nitrosacidococcus tergens]CAB1275852.1 Adenine phosphoribosyltransferase [Candidatus Nitrosacidococcus tergens]
MDIDQLKGIVRDIPDFPKPGILFKDITPLVKDPDALRFIVGYGLKLFSEQNITAVAGIEARGFIFGSLIAWELGVSFIPLRKPGKLPYKIREISYATEYSTASLEIHEDALSSKDNVLLVDDLLATGGSAKAACDLIEQLGATIVACFFVVELDFLNGKEILKEYPVHSLLHY